MRARLPNEAKKNASISPHDRGLPQSPRLKGQKWSHHPPYVGDLLQLTRKGDNNKAILHYSQVLILKILIYLNVCHTYI